MRDCANCYQGLSVLQNHLLNEMSNTVYLFRNQYEGDSLDLMEKFDISSHGTSLLFSDQKFDSLGKKNISEFILIDKEIVHFEIRKITRKMVDSLRSRLFAAQPYIKLDHMPSNFGLYSMNGIVIVKNKFTNTYQQYRGAVKSYKLAIKAESIYNRIKSKYSSIDNGYDYKEHIKGNISMKPQLNYVFAVNDSLSYGFANIFYIEKFDDALKEYIAKKELFIMQYVKGQIQNVFHLDQSRLLAQNISINEISNFSYNNGEFLFGINKMGQEAVDTTTPFIVRYSLMGEELILKNKLNIKPSKVYGKNHSAFQSKKLFVSKQFVSTPFAGEIYNYKSLTSIKLPLDDKLTINSNPRSMNYGLWDLKADALGNLFIIYSLKQDYYLGKLNFNSRKLEQELIDEKLTGVPALFMDKGQAFLIFYDAKEKSIMRKLIN